MSKNSEKTASVVGSQLVESNRPKIAGNTSCLIQTSKEHVLVFGQQDAAEVAVMSYEASQFKYGMFHIKPQVLNRSEPQINRKNHGGYEPSDAMQTGSCSLDQTETFNETSMEDSGMREVNDINSLLGHPREPKRALTEGKRVLK